MAKDNPMFKDLDSRIKAGNIGSPGDLDSLTED